MTAAAIGIQKLITSTGTLGDFGVETDAKIKFTTVNAGPTFAIEVLGRIEAQHAWTHVATITGAADHVVNIIQWNYLQVNVITYDSISNHVKLDAAGFNTDAAALQTITTPSGTSLAGVTDLTFTSSDSSITITGDGVNTINLTSLGGVTSVNTRTGAITLSATDVGLGNVTNTSDANKPVSTAQQTALNLKVDSSLIGANNGIAVLDSGGKVPVTQLPNSIMEYKGTYSALINVPSLVNGTGNTGDVYKVTVAGPGVNTLNFVVGDYVIYNGTAWEKAHSGADAVISVNGQAGAVSLAKSDIGLGNVDNTSDVNKPVSTAQASADAAVLTAAEMYADNLGAVTGATNLFLTASTGNLVAMAPNGNISLFPKTATGNVNVNFAKIIHVADPGVSSDAATKGYVDTAVSGVSGGANTTLSNLGTTAINADLIFNKANPIIKTPNSTVNIDTLTIKGGDTSDTTGAEDGGNITITAGNAPTGNLGGKIFLTPGVGTNDNWTTLGGKIIIGGDLVTTTGAQIGTNTNKFAGVYADYVTAGTNINLKSAFEISTQVLSLHNDGVSSLGNVVSLKGPDKNTTFDGTHHFDGLSIITRDDAIVDADQTLPISIETGSKTEPTATGKSGDIKLLTGSSYTDVGNILLKASDTLDTSSTHNGGNITLEAGNANLGNIGGDITLITGYGDNFNGKIHLKNKILGGTYAGTSLTISPINESIVGTTNLILNASAGTTNLSAATGITVETTAGTIVLNPGTGSFVDSTKEIRVRHAAGYAGLSDTGAGGIQVYNSIADAGLVIQDSGNFTFQGLDVGMSGKLTTGPEIIIQGSGVVSKTAPITASISATLTGWTTIRTLPEVPVTAENLKLELVIKETSTGNFIRVTLGADFDAAGWLSVVETAFPGTNGAPTGFTGLPGLRIINNAGTLELQANATGNLACTVKAKMEWVE